LEEKIPWNGQRSGIDASEKGGFKQTPPLFCVKIAD